MIDMLRRRNRHHPLWVGVLLALQLFACQPPSSAVSSTALPFGLKLEANPGFQGGYTIREADGFALVGKGVSYRDIDLQVADLLGYGVQDTALAAEVQDAHGQRQFIKVVQLGDTSQQPFRVSLVAAEVKHSGAYRWVDLPSPKTASP